VRRAHAERWSATLMLPLIAKGDPGIDREIVIDGVVLSIMPSPFDMTPDPVSVYQDLLDSGGREWQRRPHFDGIANHMDRYTITIGFGSIKDENREKMEVIRATGGIHRVVLWRMVPFVYTCVAGLQRYYLPRLRKCAAWLYDGLLIGGGVTVATDAFPTYATLNGDLLAVTYAEGPTLVTPDAGGIVIARQPDSSGAATDYTAVQLGDVPAGGDVLTIWMAPAMEMSMRAPQIRVSRAQESHAYTFVEL
jgi:hypothetical protein